MNSARVAALRWAIAIGTLVLVLAWFDPATVGARLSSTNLALALPALAGLVAVHLVGAATWRRLSDRLVGVRLDRGTSIRLYYAAQAWGAVTPGNLGADIYRVAVVGRDAGAGRLARPVLLQRLTSVGALLILGLAGALVLPIAGLGSFVLLIVVTGMGLAVAIALAAGPRSRTSGPAVRLLGRFWPADRGVGGRAWLPSVLVDGLALGLVFHGLSLALGFALVVAVDPAVAARPMEVLGALAVARLSLAVPLAPNGIGVQEGVLTFLFVQLGIAPEVALAAALLNRLSLLGTAVIGSAIQVLGRTDVRLATGPVRGATASVEPPA
jgi:uncharacterized membrane protein YbhN (UPF0104 family)